ncbi:MAG: hypothetical protein N4A40_03895 [Tissierellales bacterium]|jgi:DUF4097 and DUF4098 domain-containing protein YvlB|nr:hypothetical protein [Tissierellales bacterium]
MAANEEKLLILKMIEDGKISSTEALDLLEAVDSKSVDLTKSNGNVKWLKVRVTEGDKTKVNVNIPASLVDVGLKIAQKMSPEMKEAHLDAINFDEIADAVKNGAEGKIVDIYDEEENQKVEVFVE